MKYGRILFALSVAGALGLATSAEAAMLTAGSIGFRATTITVDGLDDILTPGAHFNFDTSSGGSNSQTTNGNPTGIFSSVPENSIITSSVLNLGASGGTGDPYLILTLGTSSFIATALLNDTLGADTRTINLSGLIKVDGFDDTPAKFSLVFSQTGGAGNAIGYAGTLAVTSAVPEPSSMIMLGLGGLGVLGSRIRRRKMA